MKTPLHPRTNQESGNRHKFLFSDVELCFHNEEAKQDDTDQETSSFKQNHNLQIRKKKQNQSHFEHLVQNKKPNESGHNQDAIPMNQVLLWP